MRCLKQHTSGGSIVCRWISSRTESVATGDSCAVSNPRAVSIGRSSSDGIRFTIETAAPAIPGWWSLAHLRSDAKTAQLPLAHYWSWMWYGGSVLVCLGTRPIAAQDRCDKEHGSSFFKTLDGRATYGSLYHRAASTREHVQTWTSRDWCSFERTVSKLKIIFLAKRCEVCVCSTRGVFLLVIFCAAVHTNNSSHSIDKQRRQVDHRTSCKTTFAND